MTTENNTVDSYEVGDVVMLKSGGGTMTVCACTKDGYQLAYWAREYSMFLGETNTMKQTILPAACLARVEKK